MAKLTSDIKNKKCVQVEKGTKPLTPEEYDSFLQNELEDWFAVENKMIQKEYKFKNFKEALAFVNRVGEIAESEGHHPDINLHGWNKVTLTFSTHMIGGLSENDFILASKIDAV